MNTAFKTSKRHLENPTIHLYRSFDRHGHEFIQEIMIHEVIVYHRLTIASTGARMDNLCRKLTTLDLTKPPSDCLKASLSSIYFHHYNRAFVPVAFLIKNHLLVNDNVLFSNKAGHRYSFRVWPSTSHEGITISADYAKFCFIENGDRLIYVGDCRNIENIQKMDIIIDSEDCIGFSDIVPQSFLKCKTILSESPYCLEGRIIRVAALYSGSRKLPFGIFNSKFSRIIFQNPNPYSTNIVQKKSMAKLAMDGVSTFCNLSRCHAELNANSIKPFRGILLSSSSRESKIEIGEHISTLLGLAFIYLDCTSFKAKYLGEVEDTVKARIKDSSRNSGILLYIDEIDLVCPKRRHAAPGSMENRLVTFFLNLLDSASQWEGSLIVASCEKLDALDEALRRPGRFDIEIDLSPPSKLIKKQTLVKYLESLSHALTTDEVTQVCESMNGYSADDISLLVREAAILQIKTDAKFLTIDHLLEAVHLVRASAIRSVETESSDIRWSDIAGQNSIKAQLKSSVLEPLERPEKFQKIGINPPKGILLYGPPGCSKTMLAKALASESGLNFLYIKGPEIFSKWVGDSEKTIREIFRKARVASPAVLFFDEFDAIGARTNSGSGQNVQDRVICQLLSELDGIEPLHNVVILAATNRPDIIDASLLRPGRLDRHLYVGLPDRHGISIMLERFLNRFNGLNSYQDNDLLDKLSGYSGAEICQIFTEVSHYTMRNNLKRVCFKFFEEAMCKIRPKTSAADLFYYNSFSTQKYR